MHLIVDSAEGMGGCCDMLLFNRALVECRLIPVSTLISHLCRPLFIPALCLSQRFLLWGLDRPPGFACMRCASLPLFWPLALASQAPPAIILAAPHRFRGPARFRGLRPSSSQGAPFWPSGLTVRRSRPPTAAAELRATRASPPLQAIPLPGLIAQRSTQAWFSSISDQFQPCACSASMLLGKRCGRRDYKRSLRCLFC